MTEYLSRGQLKIAAALNQFIEQELLPDLDIAADQFWQNFSTLIQAFMPRNQALLEKRERLQQQIDHWHQNHRESLDQAAYKNFLEEIGYLEAPVEDFQIETQNVDPEIASIAGPQLVVPVMNARFALNAANARWGSLYDALYGTDAIAQTGNLAPTAGYNPARGEAVIQYAKAALDLAAPLVTGSHMLATNYTVENGRLTVSLIDGSDTTLKNANQFKGYQGPEASPSSVLLANNGLHIDIKFDDTKPIGAADEAGIYDIQLESALSTIMDAEDSVAAVDAEDKTLVYQNWLGLMKGDLEASIEKAGKMITRRMNPDREYISPDGGNITLSGRSLLFVRNVGHLMTTPAVLTDAGNEIPEGILDGVITSLCATYNLRGQTTRPNSKTGSIYIIKPKMHGSEEVAFSCELFTAIEKLIGLPANTLKIGIMDEERRTSVNLKNCVYAAKERVIFINTGFLDRTGDEIHTSMHAGPMLRKSDMQSALWLDTYENNNVDVGLACGLPGKAQIGKGMWAMPDQMADMVRDKITHPKQGASAAWVPSPTAATLHALHYHEIHVPTMQQILSDRSPASLDNLITMPLADKSHWSAAEIQEALDNNAQGILGYVARWINQGIGCSKVPDINNIGLMEDRATLRISSQALANWLLHGVCTKDQIQTTMEKMAAIVDEQNADDPTYSPMTKDLSKSVAFQAACALVFQGASQPSGYTEPLLHAYRLKAKQGLYQ